MSDGKGGRSSARHLLAAASSVVQSTADESALRSTTLPNGLIVVSELMPGVRSVALGAWVRAASLHERREAMGVSHLLEHMVFKGTANRSARDIALALEGLGGSLDAYTAREHTAYQARALDANLRDAADVLVDLVYRPLLRASDLKLERQVVLEEISMVEDTPDDLVFELHNEALWGPHPYGYSILGTRDSVSRLGVSDLRAVHDRAYHPGQTIVAAAGNVDHDVLLDVLADTGWTDLAARPGTAGAMAARQRPSRRLRATWRVKAHRRTSCSARRPCRTATRVGIRWAW